MASCESRKATAFQLSLARCCAAAEMVWPRVALVPLFRRHNQGASGLPGRVRSRTLAIHAPDFIRTDFFDGKMLWADWRNRSHFKQSHSRVESEGKTVCPQRSHDCDPSGSSASGRNAPPSAQKGQRNSFANGAMSQIFTLVQPWYRGKRQNAPSEKAVCNGT